MSKIDALLEIEVTFFYVGDKANSSYLDDDWDCWSTPWDECIDDLPEKEKIPNYDSLEESENVCDVIFTKDTLAFRYHYITEGRTDCWYGSGVAFEEEHVGSDWFSDAVDDLVKTANEIKTEHEGTNLKRIEQDRIFKKVVEEDLPIRSFSWIEALGYYSTRYDYSGECDAGVEFLGRVKMSDLSKFLSEQQKEAKKS